MSRYYDNKFVKTKYLRKYTHNPNVDLNRVEVPKNFKRFIESDKIKVDSKFKKLLDQNNETK